MKKELKYFLLSLLVSVILYILWIQLSVGNIWWRNNSFQPQQIITFFERPFNKYGYMWELSLLDINPYVFIPIVTLVLYLFLKIYAKL